MKNCDFCNFETIIKDDMIVYQSDNFFVKVPYCVISEGHIMIVPFMDIPAYAELPDDLVSEFESIKKDMIERISKNFSEPFLVEYGVRMQSVPHAHMHFIPKKSADYQIDTVEKDLFFYTDLVYKESSLGEIRECFQRDGEYTLFEDQGKKYLFETKNHKNIETINYRYLFSNYFGVKGVTDWKKMDEEEKKLDLTKREITFKKLK